MSKDIHCEILKYNKYNSKDNNEWQFVFWKFKGKHGMDVIKRVYVPHGIIDSSFDEIRNYLNNNWDFVFNYVRSQ